MLDGICIIEKNSEPPELKHMSRDIDTNSYTDTSHLPSFSNEHDVYENHVVWSAPAMATFTDPGGLGAIMSHFGEVKAPSTHDMFKSRNYELGISSASFEFLLCPGGALNLFKLSKCCGKVCCSGILCYRICSSFSSHVDNSSISNSSITVC